MVDEPLRLSEVSEALRKALTEGQWPFLRHTALGVSVDGKRYYATGYPEAGPVRDTGRRRTMQQPPAFLQRVMGRVVIEELPYRPDRMAIPEPAETVWEPALTAQQPWVALESVSRELRRALEAARHPDGWSYASGIAPNGMACEARMHRNTVMIREEAPVGALRHSYIAEPEGAVWRGCLPDPVPVKLKTVSYGLQAALEAARWPHGRRSAIGIGRDGTEYVASLSGELVSIEEVFAFSTFGFPIPEPEGVVWKPTLTEREWVRRTEVSAGLHTALERGEPWFDKRYAAGVGPDGKKYRAEEWHDDLVFIDYLGVHSWGDCRTSGGQLRSCARIPLPEPAGVVWQAFYPDGQPTARPARGLGTLPQRGRAIWQGVQHSVRNLTARDRRVQPAAVSEALRQALAEGGWPSMRHAKGVGPDGRLYRASLDKDGVLIYAADPADRTPITVREPRGVSWRPVRPGENRYLLEDMSVGLRQALEEARWPYGRRIATGRGADGTEYEAEQIGSLVYIHELIRENPYTIAIAEPADAVWQPILTDEQCVRLAAVSAALRRALENSTMRSAHGKAPGGTNYSAYLWNGDCVFIAIPSWELGLRPGVLSIRHHPPIAEPPGVDWKPR